MRYLVQKVRRRLTLVRFHYGGSFQWRKQMKRKQLLTLMSLCGLSISAFAGAGVATQPYDPQVLAQVEQIYGLSE